MTAPRWLAVPLVVALVLHAAIAKWPVDRLPEMLWCCHVATLVMAIGLATGRRSLVAAGWLFHLPVGVVTYVLDVVTTGTTTVTSVIVHVLPLVIGLVAVRRQDITRQAAGLAWLMFLIMLPISYVATPAALNVNVAHRPWPPLASWLHGIPATWGLNLALIAAIVGVSALVLNRLIPSRASHG